MATKILNGDAIRYSCIMLTKEEFKSWMADNNPEPDVLGVVANSYYYPAEDLTIECKNHWSLPILDYYPQKHWIILAKHPGHVYSPMADITGQGIYQVMAYDVWNTEAGVVAVATDVDQD